MSDQFKDYFSVQSVDYARFRPCYPDALFQWLAENSPGHDLAWDSATGNGQTAIALAPFFDKIIATDASGQQVDNARAHEKIRYHVARSENSGLETGSVDLVTVAQAAHWFDMDHFNVEVRRVLKQDGLVALWCYGMMQVTPQLDSLVLRLYEDILGSGYWAPERKLIEQGYRTLAFPFEEMKTPGFAMTQQWSYDHLTGYLGTWSAVQDYQKQTGQNPLDLVRYELELAWRDTPGQGDAGTRSVSWPLSMRVGRV